MAYTIIAIGSTIRNALTEARKTLHMNRKDTREVNRFDHGNGMWRVELMGGTIIEVFVQRGARSKAEAIN